ncbi:MAG: hypothetical protein OXH09_17705, partial [Gammaproteobacteria bacterium]|nr:hypothetical protein [Gammaproteobacteria bacterium]
LAGAAAEAAVRHRRSPRKQGDSLTRPLAAPPTVLPGVFAPHRPYQVENALRVDPAARLVR